MTVTLTDAQYGALARALCLLARSRNGEPNNGNIPRHALITLGRRAANAIGLDWQNAFKDETLKTYMKNSP